LAFTALSFFREKANSDMENQTLKNVKNSDNNPLRIDAVDFPEGQIGLSICPGKYDDYARSGPCHRDLYKDLSLIKRWGASVLITLLEDHELEYLRVTNIGEMAKEVGLSWWRFPAPDGCPLEIEGHEILDPKFDVYTLPLALLRRYLKAGGRALVHCRGGLGRSGTFASRLLVEEGFLPSVAINKVRKSRPGAVETLAQERYLDSLPEKIRRNKPLYEALLALPEQTQGNPMLTLENDPATFRLDVWVKTVKERLKGIDGL
jgi:protein-tyrosine phosphatase